MRVDNTDTQTERKRREKKINIDPCLFEMYTLEICSIINRSQPHQRGMAAIWPFCIDMDIDLSAKYLDLMYQNRFVRYIFFSVFYFHFANVLSILPLTRFMRILRIFISEKRRKKYLCLFREITFGSQSSHPLVEE